MERFTLLLLSIFTLLPIMKRKLILPAEVKVCATCSYWDGERKIDGEYALVVVADGCEGECLVQEKQIHCLDGVHRMSDDCSWEQLDIEPEADSPAGGLPGSAPDAPPVKPEAAR